MKKLLIMMALCLLVLIPATLFAYPTIYPTGTTIYKPDKCWNGFTIASGGYLIDMNGNLVHKWDSRGVEGIVSERGAISDACKLLPGGYIISTIRVGGQGYRMERGRQVFQLDFNNNLVWEFHENIQITPEEGETYWSARQHHDFQREGNPVGYYAPGMEPLVDGGKTLIMTGLDGVVHPKISPGVLVDDRMIEISWEGEILWDWLASDHFDEMGFDEVAQDAIYSDGSNHDPYDWHHANSMNYLGPNKYYDNGDVRFHPDNIIWDARNTNIIAIIDKETGNIVWKVGPDYAASPALLELGQIIGQHHAHMIPKGLPGEGNILVFDNGGYAGYGAPTPGCPTGVMNAMRGYSRVIEFDPVTLEKVWEYKRGAHMTDCQFYSTYISSAQRLPNGNTLICEGNPQGRFFEVTPNKEIVWEYVFPWGMCYRAYRVPYEWVPQLQKPVEVAVEEWDWAAARGMGKLDVLEEDVNNFISQKQEVE
jgi:hypothetical protein